MLGEDHYTMNPFEKFIKPNKNLNTHDNINTDEKLSSNLQENIQLVKNTLGNSSDLIIREFQIGEESNIKVAIFYTDGLVDNIIIQNYILRILMLDIRDVHLKKNVESNILKLLKNCVLPNGEIENVEKAETFFRHLLSGDTILLLDGYAHGYIIDSRGWKDRGIQEADTQTVVRGPKDSFSETLLTYMALIRRRIKDTNLWMERTQIGRRTKTDVTIAYIKDIANDDIVQEVRNRLNNIDIDGILESGNIEELIQDQALTSFPTIFNTERPDTVAGGLLEGRIAIIVDGTPFVLLVPAIFFQFLKISEDYYQRFDISTLIRILRYICFIVALLTPSIYIAITTFHQEMLPTPLLISIASQREGVPFSTFIEVLLMEITFEILREAGLRMPRVIGPAISFVGALILGEAAVQAGIISATIIIVVSLTAISSFVIPSYNMSAAVRILRFIFMILATTLGLYGVSLGLIALILHLCSLRSFGVPYMSPIAPYNSTDQKDTIFRFPLWKLNTRPRLINQENRVKQQDSSKAKPAPPTK